MIKKTCGTFFLCTITLLLYAQEIKSNIIKLNPAGYFLLSGSASYERILGSQTAAQVNLVAGNAYGGEFKTTAARADFRYYFSKNAAARGFYGAVGAGYEKFSFYTSLTVNSQTYRRDYSASGFAAANYYGYQYHFKNGFSLDAFAGVQKLFSKFRDEDGFEYLPNTPKAWVLYLVPVVGVSAGFSF
ncbi:MAG: DUF3575 domain-containing protein [Ferruginibacter sp.]